MVIYQNGMPCLKAVVSGCHACNCTPIGRSGIIGGLQLDFAVGKAFIALKTVGAILRVPRGANVSFNPLVGDLSKICLRGGFTPGEVVTVFLRSVGADVTCRPQCAAGQSQVNILMIIGNRWLI